MDHFKIFILIYISLSWTLYGVILVKYSKIFFFKIMKATFEPSKGRGMGDRGLGRGDGKKEKVQGRG